MNTHNICFHGEMKNYLMSYLELFGMASDYRIYPKYLDRSD